jgi:protein transport protein SEC23
MFLFDIVDEHKTHEQMTGSELSLDTSKRHFFIQFISKYLSSSGESRMRVMTITRWWTAGYELDDLILGFDPVAAAVVLGRLCSSKMDNEQGFDAIGWLDRCIIEICSRFKLTKQLLCFTQIIFNFRKSPFVQIFNSSPDETAFYRMVLNREMVRNSITMIQPKLKAYSLYGTPKSVALEMSSIKDDCILVLDTFFSILVFYGTTIAQSRRAKHTTNQQQALFAQLAKEAHKDAETLIQKRFPVPHLVVCERYSSQARFLLAKLNPSKTSRTYQSTSRDNRYDLSTDDVSFEDYVAQLIKLIAKQ